jgi:plasmid stabilization system protein ParE
MTYAVAVSEQAARELEDFAAWWARERSVEQSERWYAGIRRAIASLAEQPDRYPKALEDGDFPYPLRELHFGLGSRPTHRAVFTIVNETVVVLTVRHAAQDRLQQSDRKTP